MLINFLPRYSDDDGAGNGGGSDDGGKVRASDLRSQLGTQVDEQALMRILEKQSELLADNHRLRTQRTNLKQQLADATGKVPVEGSRVLTTDEAKIYDAYIALGKPDALKTAIDANGQATAELAALKREKTIAKAAEAAGFKASVLAQLAGDLDIQTKAGKDNKPLAVVVKDEKETPLSDYAAQEWADFLPALETKATHSMQAPDINAGARSNGRRTEQDLIDAETQRLMRTGRYGGF
jgi:hypothetical protein